MVCGKKYYDKNHNFLFENQLNILRNTYYNETRPIVNNFFDLLRKYDSDIEIDTLGNFYIIYKI
jgi:hypothetical protein